MTTNDQLKTLLSRPVSILLLGARCDTMNIPASLAGMVRICGVDATAKDEGANNDQLVVVPDHDGQHAFHRRVFWPCSSLLSPRPEELLGYGLKEFFRESPTGEKDIMLTITELAKRQNLTEWDAIKTDLEGADFQIVRSLGGASLRHAFLVQMELRFEPFYIGEESMSTALNYMEHKGFSVLDIRPVKWRYMTEHYLYDQRGHTTHADVFFMNCRPELPFSRNEVARLVIVLILFGYLSMAEHITEQSSILSEGDKTLLKMVLIEGRSEPAPADEKFPHVVL